MGLLIDRLNLDRPPLATHPTTNLHDLLQQEMECARAWLGLMPVPVQRLYILGWVARAREHGDETASAVAGGLTTVCRTLWPGSVDALRLDTRPAYALDAVLGLVDPAPKTWSEVAARVEQELEAIAEDPADPRRWADANALFPAARDPRSTFAEARAFLEDATGPLETTVPITQLDLDRVALAEEMQGLRFCAARIRWTRGLVEARAWSLAMGRLRLVARIVRDSGLNEVLHEQTCPARGWARYLGQDPDRKRKQRSRKAALSSVPARTCELARLEHWLDDALEGLSNDEILARCPWVAGRVAELRVDRLSRGNERRIRSRVARLGRHATGPEPVSMPVVGGDQPEEASSQLDDLAALLQPHCAGRRLLFVSNRKDAHLREFLESRLGFQVKWCIIDRRRVQSACHAIAHGAHDVVLMATGFGDHTSEGMLKSACKRHGIPYRSVNKGRPLACAMVLAWFFEEQIEHQATYFWTSSPDTHAPCPT